MPSRTGPPAPYVERMFSRIAPRYDVLNTTMTLGRHRCWKRATALAAGAAQGRGPALDVATGTGDLAFTLADLPNVSSVLGVDLSGEMIRVAARKASRRPLSCPVSFLEADALALPFANDSFMCAASSFALRNVEDLETCVSEMVRVVSPGGRVAVLELSPVRGWFPLNPFLNCYVRRLVPLMGHLLAGDRSSYSYLSESIDRFPDADGLAEVLRAAGLEQVSYRRMNMGIVALHWGSKPVPPAS